MKLIELKEWVNSLPNEILEKEIVYQSEYKSGYISRIELSKEDLYCLCEDDPSCLYTKNELLLDGYTEDEIENFTIEIYEGDPVIKLY